MKKIFVSLTLLMVVITACAPQTPTEPPSIIINDPARPTPQKPTPTTAPVQPSNPVEETVVKQLAENLGLKVSDISVASNKEVEFGDACLGVAMPEIMCAQVITPGRIVVLEADGVQYEYHTNADGSHAVPATLALTWTRDGGIAGFCDRLTVFLSGEIYGNRCKSEDGRMKTFADLLSATEQKQFTAWIAKYGQVNLDASDPKGVADGMTVLLSLYGNGNAQLSKDDEAAIFLWAQAVFQKLYE